MFKKIAIQGVFISLLIGGCSIKKVSLEHHSSDKPVVLFILDSSESMLNLEKGKPKIDNAKKAILNTISKIDEEKFNTALITYDNVRRCRAKAKVKLGSPTNILNQINSIEAWGVSPLADAIRLSSDMLSNTEKKMIILLSDGKDNCGGDPIAEAKKLYKKYGAKVNLQVIGYAVEKKKQEELKKIATISKDWMYHDTINGESAKKMVEKIVNKIMPKETKTEVITPIVTQSLPKVEQKEPVITPIEVENKSLPTIVVYKSIENNNIDSSNFKFEFDSGSNNLKSIYLPKIEELNEYLVNNDKSILLIGHTDSRGTESFNQQLSIKRAKSIKLKLIELGVKPSKIKITGRGEGEPIAPNNTPQGRQVNRRVEIKILD